MTDQISPVRLRELLDYDPEDGTLTWRHRPNPTNDRGISMFNGKLAGRKTGHLGNHGYRSVNIDGRLYLAHRVIWAIMTGDWPIDVIDHRNGVLADNRFCNLREATRTQNMQNSKMRKDSQHKLKGIIPRAGGRWAATIQAAKKVHMLGVFATPEEAHAAYCAAARELHGDFANFGYVT